MGFFGDQLADRQKKDNEAFERAFTYIGDAILGEGKASGSRTDAEITRNAIGEILNYYKIEVLDIPNEIRDTAAQLEYLLRPSGVMRRNVLLTSGWYKDAAGAMLARTKDGKMVALIPSKFEGYTFYDSDKGKRVRVNSANENQFEREAICFYTSFPRRSLKTSEVIWFAIKSLPLSDYLLFGVACLVASIVGMIIPYISKYLFETVAAQKDYNLLIAVGISMLCVILSIGMLNVMKALLRARIITRMDIKLNAAVMIRLISLPTDFFKDKSSGELATVCQTIQDFCKDALEEILEIGISGLFTLVYIIQLYFFLPQAAIVATIVIFSAIIFAAIAMKKQAQNLRKVLELEAKTNGMSYSLISGIQKIKLAGAEKRAFEKWAYAYSKACNIKYNVPLVVKVSAVVNRFIFLIGNILIYIFAVRNQADVASFFAFMSAFVVIQTAFDRMGMMVPIMAQMGPTFDMLSPIFEQEPETSESKTVVDRLSGSIELTHVTFRYNEEMPPVIDDLSLTIRSGQYVAIVGETGCGKSTLLRLLLGFENPQKGAIYYDGKDINTLDLKSLRKNIGIVMQNGKLFQGDIFSNIVISAPWMTLDDAWKAAEMVGLADDIREMPMGMSTVISEGQGGISGGQKQRILIARAIVSKSKILMFDEATSALDNVTQKMVSTSLDGLKCTRIVIAHRLSTIKKCDRILVLDKGKIIEDGSYDDLIAKDGNFADLVSRQRLDDTEYVGRTTTF